MQRILKYHLLLDKLIENTDPVSNHYTVINGRNYRSNYILLKKIKKSLIYLEIKLMMGSYVLNSV